MNKYINQIFESSSKIVYDSLYTNNKENLFDYSTRTDTGFRQQKDKDRLNDSINNINWDLESNYHNSYRVNGKYVIGRTIKMPNKKWHMLNKQS